MEFDFYTSLVFAGILQGIILSLFVLIFNKHRTKASLYLGLMLLALSLSNLQYITEDLGWLTWHEFNMIYVPLLFLLTPLLYFFVTYLLYPKHKIKRIEWFLYLPAIFFFGVSLLYKIMVFTTGKTVENDGEQEWLADIADVYGDFVNIALLFVIVIYLLSRVSHYQRKRKETARPLVKGELLWLNIVLGILLIITIPWLYYTYLYMQDEDVAYQPMYVLASVVIYVIGYIGVHKINILHQREKIRSFHHSVRNHIIADTSVTGHIDAIEHIVKNKKRYLDPSFSLETLAQEMGISKSHLSRIINSEFGQNFSDYINTQRVETAKIYLQNPDFSNYTLVAIGLEAGFNSKTTFNTSFKKITGKTPSAFRKSLSN